MDIYFIFNYIGEKSEEVFYFPDADPYLEEDKMFIEAVRSGDTSKILSNYGDASKTYELSWCVRKSCEENM